MTVQLQSKTVREFYKMDMKAGLLINTYTPAERHEIEFGPKRDDDGKPIVTKVVAEKLPGHQPKDGPARVKGDIFQFMKKLIWSQLKNTDSRFKRQILRQKEQQVRDEEVKREWNAIAAQSTHEVISTKGLDDLTSFRKQKEKKKKASIRPATAPSKRRDDEFAEFQSWPGNDFVNKGSQAKAPRGLSAHSLHSAKIKEAIGGRQKSAVLVPGTPGYDEFVLIAPTGSQRKWAKTITLDFTRARKSLVLGRSDACDIKLDTAHCTKEDLKSISREHCTLTIDDNGTIILEDHSGNGTLVNDVLVKEGDSTKGYDEHGNLAERHPRKCTVNVGDTVTFGAIASDCTYVLALKSHSKGLTKIDMSRLNLPKTADALTDGTKQARILAGDTQLASAEAHRAVELWSNLEYATRDEPSVKVLSRFATSGSPQQCAHAAAALCALSRDDSGLVHVLNAGGIAALSTLASVNDDYIYGLEMCKEQAVLGLRSIIMRSAQGRERVAQDGALRTLRRIASNTKDDMCYIAQEAVREFEEAEEREAERMREREGEMTYDETGHLYRVRPSTAKSAVSADVSVAGTHVFTVAGSAGSRPSSALLKDEMGYKQFSREVFVNAKNDVERSESFRPRSALLDRNRLSTAQNELGRRENDSQALSLPTGVAMRPWSLSRPRPRSAMSVLTQEEIFQEAAKRPQMFKVEYITKYEDEKIERMDSASKSGYVTSQQHKKKFFHAKESLVTDAKQQQINLAERDAEFLKEKDDRKVFKDEYMPGCPRGPPSGSSADGFLQFNETLKHGLEDVGGGIYRQHRQPWGIPRDIDDVPAQHLQSLGQALISHVIKEEDESSPPSSSRARKDRKSELHAQEEDDDTDAYYPDAADASDWQREERMNLAQNDTPEKSKDAIASKSDAHAAKNKSDTRQNDLSSLRKVGNVTARPGGDAALQHPATLQLARPVSAEGTRSNRPSSALSRKPSSAKRTEAQKLEFGAESTAEYQISLDPPAVSIGGVLLEGTSNPNGSLMITATNKGAMVDQTSIEEKTWQPFLSHATYQPTVRGVYMTFDGNQHPAARPSTPGGLMPISEVERSLSESLNDSEDHSVSRSPTTPNVDAANMLGEIREENADQTAQTDVPEENYQELAVNALSQQVSSLQTEIMPVYGRIVDEFFQLSLVVGSLFNAEQILNLVQNTYAKAIQETESSSHQSAANDKEKLLRSRTIMMTNLPHILQSDLLSKAENSSINYVDLMKLVAPDLLSCHTLELFCSISDKNIDGASLAQLHHALMLAKMDGNKIKAITGLPPYSTPADAIGNERTKFSVLLYKLQGLLKAGDTRESSASSTPRTAVDLTEWDSVDKMLTHDRRQLESELESACLARRGNDFGLETLEADDCGEGSTQQKGQEENQKDKESVVWQFAYAEDEEADVYMDDDDGRSRPPTREGQNPAGLPHVVPLLNHESVWEDTKMLQRTEQHSSWQNNFMGLMSEQDETRPVIEAEMTHGDLINESLQVDASVEATVSEGPEDDFSSAQVPIQSRHCQTAFTTTLSSEQRQRARAFAQRPRSSRPQSAASSLQPNRSECGVPSLRPQSAVSLPSPSSLSLITQREVAETQVLGHAKDGAFAREVPRNPRPENESSRGSDVIARSPPHSPTSSVPPTHPSSKNSDNFVVRPEEPDPPNMAAEVQAAAASFDILFENVLSQSHAQQRAQSAQPVRTQSARNRLFSRAGLPRSPVEAMDVPELSRPVTASFEGHSRPGTAVIGSGAASGNTTVLHSNTISGTTSAVQSSTPSGTQTPQKRSHENDPAREDLEDALSHKKALMHALEQGYLAEVRELQKQIQDLESQRGAQVRPATAAAVLSTRATALANIHEDASGSGHAAEDENDAQTVEVAGGHQGTARESSSSDSVIASYRIRLRQRSSSAMMRTGSRSGGEIVDWDRVARPLSAAEVIPASITDSLQSPESRPGHERPGHGSLEGVRSTPQNLTALGLSAISPAPSTPTGSGERVRPATALGLGGVAESGGTRFRQWRSSPLYQRPSIRPSPQRDRFRNSSVRPSSALAILRGQRSRPPSAAPVADPPADL